MPNLPPAIKTTLALLVSTFSAHANEGLEYFEKNIRPLLVQHCYECHSADSKKLKANLFLDSRHGWQSGGDSGPALIPGEPGNSLLYQVVAHTHGDLEMPPKNRLSSTEVNHFKHWITIGAPDPRGGDIKKTTTSIDLEKGRQFWSFQAPKKHPVPAVENSSWPRNQIDYFILARLEAENISPAKDASKQTLLRRLHYDLTGLPPSPPEMAAFLADPSLEKVIDDLLARPEFGERWGRHWLDVTRFAESSGGGRSLVFPDAWRFRDYVIASFNQDKPYDQLIREHLAGDLLPSKNPAQRNAQLTGSGYLVLGALNYELQDHELLKMEFVDEQIDTVGRTFLGMTLGCARCHDHKFDPIPTTDYYALAGIFQSTESMGKGSAANGVTSFATTRLEVPHTAEIKKIQDSLSKLSSKIATLKSTLGEKTDTRSISPKNLPGIVLDSEKATLTGDWIESTYTPNYIGKNYLQDDNSGKGKKQAEFTTTVPTGTYDIHISYTAGPNRAKNVPVTVRHLEGEETFSIDQTQPAPIQGCLLKIGTFDFNEDNPATVVISNEGTSNHVIVDAVTFTEKESLKSLATSRKKTTADLKKLQKTHKTLTAKLKKLQPVTMAVSEAENIANGHVHIRGQVRNKGPQVPRGFLTVASKENFSPTIPADHSGRLELAHWIAHPDHPLTARVIVNRVWKYLLGEGIVRTPDNLGKTGELPSHPKLLDHLAVQFTQNGWSLKTLIREIVLSRTYQLSSQKSHHHDPENRLFSRANRKRLTAESLRDTILTISGSLDETRGGPTIRNAGQYDLNYQFNSNRRSIYVPWFRNSMLPIFEVFDAPNPNLVVGKRPVTNLPTQSLFLMNSPFIREQASLTAQGLLEKKTTLTDTYQIILNRPPSESELTTTQTFLENFPDSQNEEAWTQLVQTLFATLDFRFLD